MNEANAGSGQRGVNMLYVFVHKEREAVYYATYNKEEAEWFAKDKTIKLASKYFEDVIIYEVIL